ncbi:hypothetical protein [Pseudomonas savastanoi]|uniref:hypothetical protein n=1 Tax=Pseudomonas savastanoi TaxID=29438 RepID=UPI001785F5B9|nr:hypothetical protein [Pseudomonas savastanoi]
MKAGKICGYAASCFSGNARNMEKNGGKSARAAGKKMKPNDMALAKARGQLICC